MSRQDRAKQFAPFDALKGLSKALRLKEYKHDQITQGQMSEEDATKISNTLAILKKNDQTKVIYFDDGYYKEIKGKTNLFMEEGIIEVENQKIDLKFLKDIEIINLNNKDTQIK